MRMWMLALALAACAPLYAQQSPAVGDVAPDFGATLWLDAPRKATLAEYEGDVVFLKAWGID